MVRNIRRNSCSAKTQATTLVVCIVLAIYSMLMYVNSTIQPPKRTNIKNSYNCILNCTKSSLETCPRTCGPPLVWPAPKTIQQTNPNYTWFNPSSTIFTLNPTFHALTLQATDIFRHKLSQLVPNTSSDHHLHITLTNMNPSTVKLTLAVDESYHLKVTKIGNRVNVDIIADNFFGLRHGLETLLQLVWYDQQPLILHGLEIEDGPSFPYRGLLVDTARNYFSIEKLMRVIDGMAMVKLNVFHWHITDAQSFPVVLPHVENLTSPYSAKEIYTTQDVRNMVEYARVRGVRVLLEVDAPGHVGPGWDPNLLICQSNKTPFMAHLDVDNPETLATLRVIYGDLLELMQQNDLFHIGNDEVDLKCLQRTTLAHEYGSALRAWEEYTLLMLKALTEANGGKPPENVIMWSSKLTENYKSEYLKNVAVQFWLGDPDSLIDEDHKLIYSMVDNWYLDCGFGSWWSTKIAGVCDPFRPWQKFYGYRPWVEHGGRTLGGEVCLWSEEVSEASLETRLWPRTAAFGERVWRDPEDGEDMKVVAWRLDAMRVRMAAWGIEGGAIWPRWCGQNPGKC